MITVTDAAAIAAAAAYRGVPWVPASNPETERLRVDSWRAAVEAALPHLTDTGEPLAPSADGQAAYMRGWTAALDYQSGQTGPPATGRDAERDTRMYQLGRRDAEQAHTERAIRVAATESQVLGEMVNYPSDYELWRDALQLGLQRELGLARASEEWSRPADAQIREAARWFWHELQEARPQLEATDPTFALEGTGIPEVYTGTAGTVTWSAEDGTRVDGEHRPPPARAHCADCGLVNGHDAECSQRLEAEPKQ